MLVAYRRLHPLMPKLELLALLRQALDPLRAAVGSATAQALDAVDDPFVKIVEDLEASRRAYFRCEFCVRASQWKTGTPAQWHKC